MEERRRPFVFLFEVGLDESRGSEAGIGIPQIHYGHFKSWNVQTAGAGVLDESAPEAQQRGQGRAADRAEALVNIEQTGLHFHD
jgi:hypothetical protein